MLLARRECCKDDRGETDIRCEADTCAPFFTSNAALWNAYTLQEWDIMRTKRTDALDEILEALGAQVVPPDFYETAIDNSLFGSQHPSDIEPAASNHRSAKSSTSSGKSSGNYSNSYGNGWTNASASINYGRPSTSPVSPSATIRRNGSLRKDISGSNYIEKSVVNKNLMEDRKRWKTLRDFVDDQAIEDTVEMIETDRSNLDVSHTFTIAAIYDIYPHPSPLPHRKLPDERMTIQKRLRGQSSLSKPRYRFRSQVRRRRWRRPKA